MSSFVRHFPILLLCAIGAILLTGCETEMEAPVASVQATLPPPTVQSQADRATPAPLATEAVPPGTSSAHVSTGYQALHGEPPYTAELEGSMSNAPSPCEAILWDFGDGSQETQDCPDDVFGYLRWTTEHRYEKPGTYHVTVSVQLEDGSVLQGNKSQTVVVAEPQRPTLQAVVIRWVAWVVTLFGIGLSYIWLRCQPSRYKRGGFVLLALLLITFVPPFSYVPDPLGVVLGFTGDYRHDPRLPFANRFLIAGDPTERLRPFLDGLIGMTGLDPLDPVSPLARYEFVGVRAGVNRLAVDVRFTYEDGGQRTYPIPLFQPDHFLGFYQCCWQYDGLARLRAEHRALPPVPFAQAGSGVELSTPQRLPLPGLEEENPAHWYSAGIRGLEQQLLWAPAGDAFLSRGVRGTDTTLWLFNLDSSVRRLADDVATYAWLPDGQGVIYTDIRFEQHAGETFQRLYRVPRDGGEAEEILQLRQSAFPGINEEGLWTVEDGALWLLPFAQKEPQQLATLPGLTGRGSSDSIAYRVLIWPAPDGERVVYTCGGALCLVDRDGSEHVQIAPRGRYAVAAWHPDGERLAVVYWDYQGPATLLIVNRDGDVLQEVLVAQDGAVAAPQWVTSVDDVLFLQTTPRGGRRIIAVDVNRGEAWDLSQPRWDTFFALHPDGDRLLLHNGRGGFWLVPVEYFASATR